MPIPSSKFTIIPANTPRKAKEKSFRKFASRPSNASTIAIETAKVVGKKGEDGEEISTDENGHIWVQFYWDREPQKSCPIRVAQCWSGKQWGEQHIPRVGMEVVVEFCEGDPDRPLVTGCVYNGDNKYPYNLPGNKTQSGWKSDSSKGHGGYNELMFEDKKGSEEVRFHAQKDLDSVIENNETRKVGNDQTLTVGNDQTETIQNNRSVTVMMNDSLEVDMNRSATVLANDSLEVDMNRSATIAMTDTVMADAMITLMCGSSVIIMTPGSIVINSPSILLIGPTAMSGPGVIGTPPMPIL